MRINHNVTALNTHRQLANNQELGAKSTEKLSSGLRINRAGDDAAGLAISEKMRAQIRGLDQATRNSQDGISLIQTAEGALNETHSILQRMRELAVQASNGTSTTADKTNIQTEINQLINEVDRIANDTEFNTMKLLNGDLSKTSKFATENADALGISTVKAFSTSKAGTTYIISSGALGAATASTFTLSGVLSTLASGTAYTGSLATGGATLTTLSYVSATGSLASGGAVSGNNAASLGLAVGDEITISAVVGGESKSAVYVVTTSGTLSDFYAAVQNVLGSGSSVGATSGVATSNTAGAGGLDSALSGSGFTGTTATGALVITGQTGSANAITSLNISAKDSTGNSKTTFNSLFGSGLNGGLEELQVAADNGDVVVHLDTDGDGTAGSAEAGESRIAVRSNATITTSNLQVTFGTVAATATGTITVGSRDQRASLLIGANGGQNVKVDISAVGAVALGLKTNGVNLSVLTKNDAEAAISTIDAAISTVSSQRSNLGAIQNRLEHTINNLGTASENLTSSESRIRDVDMAKEMMNFTKMNILTQAAQSMLAQANQAPQGVLQLLR